MHVKNKHTDWHHLTEDAVLSKLKTTDNGLSHDEAEIRLKKYGKNCLPHTDQQSVLMRFLLQFHNILIYVLIFSAVITASMNHWIDTSVILAAVIINAIVGYIQEGKAEKAMDTIRHLLAPRAHVLRNNQQMTIDGDLLVPGDIVLLKAGDKVPADIRLLTVYGLSIQEAILTGESVPVEKHVDPVAKNTMINDRSCMAFSGTLITSGQANGVVVATGKNTEIGHINKMLATVETLTTPFVEQMNLFSKWLTVIILTIAALLLAYGYYIIHENFDDIFMVVVGLSVSAIPEGLPAVLTIALAIGVQSMAKRNAIVRRLPAIETLGSVSVICTDKTGTLTRNEMIVSSIITCLKKFTLEGTGYEPTGTLKLDNSHVIPGDYPILIEIARAAALCNDSTLQQHHGTWTVDGDPMEGALLAFAGKMNIDATAEQKIWTRTDIIPFDANHRYMATLNHDHEHHAFIFVKGAPERILEMCKNQRSLDGKIEPLNAAEWNHRAEIIATQGQRVLAFAIRSVNPEKTILEHNDVEGSLTLLGMLGIIDLPRMEAITAVKTCHQAGIHVKMITGDHAKTAAAIGKIIGLENADIVLTGTDLDKLDDHALMNIVLQCDIYARTSPEHKLRLVKALQSHQMIVAMTGDGVNDAPALKRADIGIAMGKKGSEAAKESSDIVLADDNFSSIIAAIREGRTVYDNIIKVISWTLPTNAGEAMTIIVALLFGMTLPVTPIQILWVNLITEVTLGIALAFEPTEDNTMYKPPRRRQQPLLSIELMWHIILVSILILLGVYGIYTYAIKNEYSIELARTMSVNTLVVMEIFHLFFIRNIYSTSLTWKAIRGTKFLWLSIIIITIAQLSITYIPTLQRIFSTQSIPFWDGILIIAIGITLFIIIEIEKQIRLTFKRLFKIDQFNHR